MVFILVAVVKGVFICFALMAVCYRYPKKNQNITKSYQNREQTTNSGMVSAEPV
jgi:heme/copper-type cytochrome/quinol oxidase subunit 2